MLPLAGYADRLSVRPGETIAFKVSNATGAPVTTRLVRVISADPNPEGPGIREEPLEHSVRVVREPERYGLQRGSYARIDGGIALAGLSSFTLIATVQPTHIGRNCSILSLLDAEGRHGVGIGMDEAGRFVGTFAMERYPSGWSARSRPAAANGIASGSPTMHEPGRPSSASSR